MTRSVQRNRLGRFVSPMSPSERFWSKIDKSGECWVWKGRRTPDGYGLFSIGKKAIYAHRFALEESGVSLSGGKRALHHCDNPPCVRPSHLYAGTQSQNMLDAYRRGRRRSQRRVPTEREL